MKSEDPVLECRDRDVRAAYASFGPPTVASLDNLREPGEKGGLRKKMGIAVGEGACVGEIWRLSGPRIDENR